MAPLPLSNRKEQKVNSEGLIMADEALILTQQRRPRETAAFRPVNRAKQSQFPGLVQNRVTLSVNQLHLSTVITCYTESTYVTHVPRAGQRECYPGRREPEPGQFPEARMCANPIVTKGL